MHSQVEECAPKEVEVYKKDEGWEKSARVGYEKYSGSSIAFLEFQGPGCFERLMECSSRFSFVSTGQRSAPQKKWWCSKKDEKKPRAVVGEI